MTTTYSAVTAKVESYREYTDYNQVARGVVALSDIIVSSGD